MGPITAASLKAATTIQTNRASGFLGCFELTIGPYSPTHTFPMKPAPTTALTKIGSMNDNTVAARAVKNSDAA